MLDSPTNDEATGTRYRFVRALARGGMAEVYVGEAVAPGGVRRKVALKRVLPEHSSDDEFGSMFQQEARLAATLQHPNIVQVFDVLKARGEFVLVMELLEGGDLRQLLRQLREKRQQLSVAEALFIVDRVLAGLHHAHEHEMGVIVHRDISPHNVFVTRGGVVKVLDFGIAKAIAMVDQTQSGVIKGKVRYLAPEQCNARPVDRRTDVYAAGTLLYLLLTMRLPHSGDAPYKTIHSILTKQPEPVSMWRKDLPDGVEELVAKAMAKEPDDRFQTARDMQEAIVKLVREHNLFCRENDLGARVTDVLGPPDSFDESTLAPKSLPAEIVVGEQNASSYTGAHQHSALLISTDTVVLQRVGGVMVLQLSGPIDERFDPKPLIEHIHGELVLDTGGVRRVTSFGVRSLLTFDKAVRDRVSAVYHVNCSVPFVSQISMMRAVLMRGKVLSFHLPYVDPDDGVEYDVLVSGEQAEEILKTRTPPQAPVPDAEDRMGEFDENPDGYLCFGEDFIPVPPAHVSAALRALEKPDERRQVEVRLDDNSTTVIIRRPLTEGYRWRRMVKGLDGSVVLDLDAVVSWDDDGVQALTRAFTVGANQLTAIRLHSAPVDLYNAMRAVPSLAKRWKPGSVRLQTLCSGCGSMRRVLVQEANFPRIRRTGVVREVCPKCAGSLMPSDDVPGDPEPAPPTTGAAVNDVAAPTDARSKGLPKLFMAGAVLGAALIGIAVFMMVFLGFAFVFAN